jgi:copper transport protein
MRIRHGLSTILLTWLLIGLLTTVVTVWVQAPAASAHAELLGTTPPDGARLDRAPVQVTLRFSEDVDLVDGGLRLVNGQGNTVSTRTPTTQGHTLRWSMPTGLGDGTYLVNWRVVSADGHPVSGAFAFGIRADSTAAGSAGDRAETAPWPVVAVRFAGYLAFALLVGVAGFVTWCSAASRRDSDVQVLARAGLVGGVVATMAGLLVQGPYVTGAAWGRLFEPVLVKQTATTPFGGALLWRLALLGMLFFGIWNLERLKPLLTRWLIGAGIVATAVTFASAGHGAASGRRLDLGVATVHVLAASLWVGGLITLAVAGRSVERRALQQFSQLTLGSVLVLVASGIVNSVLHLDSINQLFETRYGLLLTVKIMLVAGALTAAAVSRRVLHAGTSPARSVRLEAAVTVVVLGLTAALTLTSPPATIAHGTPTGSSTDTNPRASQRHATMILKLRAGRSALVHVLPPSTAGSKVSVGLIDADQQPLSASHVKIQFSLPARGIDNINVPLSRARQVWDGTYRFPFPGTWTMTLTIEDESQTALVTTANVSISGE